MISLFKNLKKKDWIYIIFVVGLIVLQVFLELKLPDYTAKLTTIVQNGKAEMAEVWKNGGLMLACAGGSLLCAVICSVLVSRVASSFSKTLREELFNKIASFSNEEIKKFSVPSLITRTTNDVMQLQNFMAMGVQLMFKAPIMAIWAICKISSTNISWTMAILISVVIIVVCIGILVGICLPKFRKIQKLTDDINNVTRENISGVRVVRAFNAENYQEEKFEKTNKEITDINLFTSRTMGFLMPIMTLAMNGLMVAIYWIGAILINNIALTGDVGVAIAERITTVGNMAAFTQYAMQVIMSFMMLIIIFIILPRTIISGNRIAEVLKVQPSIKNGVYNGKTELSGKVTFNNVCFKYPDADGNENALTDVSFEINKGQTLAIIGATGSAKTTLINLISRVYDATKGDIYVDGVNVKDYDEHALRNKISVASQKAVLFKGSVKDNVVYGSKIIDKNRINKALNISCSNFVFDLKDGVNSRVAQGGTNFSGGQKQRLSIARALYKDSEIIIFDDTFSALDYKTDRMVRQSIKNNLSDKTIIIVAQRIGTIKDADKIIVLDEGRVVGEGSHKQLLETCNLYKEIALSQLSKEEL